MTTSNLPIEELRKQLAQIPVQSQSAVGSDTVYRELIGFVPPFAEARDAAALESMLRAMHEQIRLRALIPSEIDAKAAHLILLAMMLTEHGAVAAAQGIAARRAGASWDELRAMVGLAVLLYGLPAVNRGEECLTAVAEREHAERVAGAVASYA